MSADILRTIIDAMPFMVLLVDNDVRICEYNIAASSFFGTDRKKVLRKRGGDILHCIHSLETPEGCGSAPYCKECIIRTSVGKAFEGQKVIRSRHKLELKTDGNMSVIDVLVTTVPVVYNGKNYVLVTLEDISELMELKKLIPICASCKKILKNDKGWVKLEKYFKEESNMNFSHHICPDCYKRQLKKLGQKIESSK